MSVRGPSDVGASNGIDRVHARSIGSARNTSAPKGDAEVAGKDVVVAPRTRASSAIASRDEDARANHVATIRAQVDAGTYVVDRGKLSQKMLDEELARAGRQ